MYKKVKMFLKKAQNLWRSKIMDAISGIGGAGGGQAEQLQQLMAYQAMQQQEQLAAPAAQEPAPQPVAPQQDAIQFSPEMMEERQA